MPCRHCQGGGQRCQAPLACRHQGGGHQLMLPLHRPPIRAVPMKKIVRETIYGTWRRGRRREGRRGRRRDRARGIEWYLKAWRPNPCCQTGDTCHHGGGGLLFGGRGEIRTITMSTLVTPRSTYAVVSVAALQPSSDTSEMRDERKPRLAKRPLVS
jgi:hypothetical protein